MSFIRLRRKFNGAYLSLRAALPPAHCRLIADQIRRAIGPETDENLAPVGQIIGIQVRLIVPMVAVMMRNPE